MTKKIILLSGPSCVGKTPLIKSFARTHPYKKFGRPVLYTSRPPRPLEQDGVDYHFRSEEDIRALPRDRFIVARTRRVWQAIDLDELDELLAEHDLVIYDIHPELVRKFAEHPRVQNPDVVIKRIFLQPASLEEIENIHRLLGDVSRAEAVASIMTPKLVSRAQQQGVDLTEKVMQDIAVRAAAAWDEIETGQSYDHIIINHDGEECANWKETPPRGEAGKTLREFVKIVNE